MNIEVDPEGTVICGWFAMCANPAEGYVDHPIGPVPCCKRCATKHELDLVVCEVELLV